ncbi:MAG: sigma-54-dependent Fis family transcriptional regulator [Candidatus Scalindua sp. AMX11]|nr:MAG: sigma-54-dependent Fis family transcriptional regulator [Candidatus Scalindua sp.]NOG83505.1 sigma-54-dependent Fis family transcriptional regulator [Planctomycetota bacterium]RZV72089.1 MAG: sigma-54-dependent Fis family transcriptional regulator [Candidatus Scalindua sp. SCAELEC01]TDE64360.1 MAG: sigma-54-dependent Fis family transcriptional regulator [Candidatus Scalindua sp. AMX11]GJQ59893.1 MAG: acetoacetate metabolism regulatory protein AtoC [Candidatus Scalindua sp.]
MKKQTNLLVVEDDLSMREFLSDLLSSDYNVDCSVHGGDAKKKLLDKAYELVITDVIMPEVSGIEVLKHVKEQCPGTAVIVITGHSTIQQAVELVKLGADDYFSKPFNIDDLLLVIEKTLKHKKFLNERKKSKETDGKPSLFPEIIGKAKVLKPIFEMMRKVAETDATVLIQGESGTGKELVARAIHEKSPRNGRSFIPINCGAIPETLLESELFGHEKGAFTGALVRKFGLFEIANEGTIFLDEIGEMSLTLQIKLLRVLETGTFRHIGDTNDITVNVRIVAATNKNLKDAVANNEFREDLYYRLNVFPLVLPPLRERKEDLDLLVHYFLKKNKLEEKNVGFSDDAFKVLEKHNWPGNVRELENVIKRAGILCAGKEIAVEHLPREIRFAGNTALSGTEIYEKTFKAAKAEFEKNYLERLLERTSYDITRASKFAQVTRAYVYEMLKKYNIDYKRK